VKRASDERRKSWIIRLHRMLCPESGRVIAASFVGEHARYRKGIDKHGLDARIMRCEACGLKRCPRACGWGDLNARHMIVGQSLHEPGAFTGMPFIVGSGLLIDAALRLVGLSRVQVFLTNAVHCHPDRNRPSLPAELAACRPFLAEEIALVKPDVVIALGNDAKASVAAIQEANGIPTECAVVNLIHPAATMRMPPEAAQDFVLRLATELERY
jgi:uracil-DNA glycosylase family 4